MRREHSLGAADINGSDNNQGLLNSSKPMALPPPRLPVSYALEDNGRAVPLLKISLINLSPRQKATFTIFAYNLCFFLLMFMSYSDVRLTCCKLSTGIQMLFGVVFSAIQGPLLFRNQFVCSVNHSLLPLKMLAVTLVSSSLYNCRKEKKVTETEYDMRPHLSCVQVRKTLDATMQTLQDMLTVEDFDVSDAFQHSRSTESIKSVASESYMSKTNIAKRRSNQQETEMFYFSVSFCHSRSVSPNGCLSFM